jgi:hypothetical protein
MRQNFFVSACLLILIGCPDRKTTASHETIEAAPIAVASTFAPAEAPLSDLLHATRASVAVSSNVDNPRDYPEHLVDGRPETAWNGRTGDLVGGFVKFQVPDDAQIDHLEMSAGFDKIGKDGDLFTMNHRIKRVRVLREGKLVREHTFDIDVRAPQSIPIRAAGGTFKIEVLETIPGSKKDWRELCVSELRVLGTPGASALAKPATPIVTIGMLPHEYEKLTRDANAQTRKLLGDIFPSLEAFCKAWDKGIGPLLDARRSAGETMVPRDHACRVAGPLSASFTPTSDIHAVTKLVLFAENWSEERFAIETPSGVIVVDTKPLDMIPFNDPGCFGGNTVTIDMVAATGKSLTVLYTDAWKNDRTYYDEDGGITSSSTQDDTSKIEVACTPAGGRMKCARRELSRTCHIDGSVVDCHSF